MTYGSQIEEFRVSDLKLERSETDRPSKPAVSGLNVTCFQSAETHNLRSQSVAICKAGEWFIPLTGFRMRKRKNGPLTGYASPSPVSHKATKKHAQCGGLPTAHTTPTEGLPQLPPLRPAASTQSPHRRAAPRQSQTHIDALRCESSSSMPSRWFQLVADHPDARPSAVRESTTSAIQPLAAGWIPSRWSLVPRTSLPAENWCASKRARRLHGTE